MNDILCKMSHRPLQTGMVVSAMLAVYLFVNAMAFPLDHNEHMYLTGAHFLKTLELYRDFTFLQMPYMPILYDAVFRIVNAEHLLLVGRICTLIFALTCCGLIWLIVFRMTNDYPVSHFALMVFGFSYYIQDISAEASNYMMPMAASLMAFMIFQHVLKKPELRLPQMFCAGFFMGISIGTKLYYAPFAVPFLLCSAIYPTYETIREKLLHQTAPFFLGIGVSLIPVGHYLFNYPEAFFFNNIQYHFINSQWRGFDLGSNIGYRIESALQVLTIYPSNMAFNVLLGLIVTRSFKSVPVDARRVLMRDPVVALSFSLFLVGFVVAIFPLPIFVYYFAACFPFVVILGCALLKRAPFIKWPRIHKFIAVLSILVIFGSAAVNFSHRLGDFTRIKSWTGFKTHDISMQIMAQLSENHLCGPIATLSPLYAIEAGMPVYPQFSSGPFVFRVGNLVNPAELQKVHGVSPDTLYALFEKQPPGAVIVGLENPVEIPLITYGSMFTNRESRFGRVRVLSADASAPQQHTPETPSETRSSYGQAQLE